MTQSTIARAIAARWRWLLAGLLLAALLMRLHGIGFGLPALNDPDELMFELGAIRMMRTLSLDPGWFGHPATTTRPRECPRSSIARTMAVSVGEVSMSDTKLPSIFISSSANCRSSASDV